VRVALDRASEAETDGLDHGVDEKWNVPLRERVEGRIDALERGAEVWDGDDANVLAGELARDVEVGCIHAQHHCRSRACGGAYLAGVESVDAHAHPGGHE